MTRTLCRKKKGNKILQYAEQCIVCTIGEDVVCMRSQKQTIALHYHDWLTSKPVLVLYVLVVSGNMNIIEL